MQLLGTGVYCWKNLINGKVYVGSSSRSLESRRKTHLLGLRSGTHWNQHLQRAWDKYGEEGFEFIVLTLCDPKDCIVFEQCWLDHYQSFDDRYGYNISPTAGSSRGTRMTEEQKERYTEGAKKRMEDPEFRERSIRNLTLGKKGSTKSKEHRENLARAATGKKQSAETIAKRVAKLRGRSRTQEQRSRMAAAALENRENRRRAALTRWHGTSQ